MEELLMRAGGSFKTFSPGEKVSAKLLKITKKTATFDIGGKSEAVVVGDYFDEAREFLSTLKEGDDVDVEIISTEPTNDGLLVSLGKSAFDAVWEKLESARGEKKQLTVTVKSGSSAGLVVEYDGVSGFIPKSQLGSDIAKDTDKLVGTRIKVKPVEVGKRDNKLVFSEREVSEADEINLVRQAMETIDKDEVFEGTVMKVTNFGAFVEISVKVGKKEIPVEGLVHVSELSWEKTADPADEVKVGDKIKVKMLGVDRGKLALSAKAAQDDPWEAAEKKYKKDQKVVGKVVRQSDFGTFVELEPGIEGLIHITKIPPGKRFEKSQEVACYVEEVDKKERRISLGLILTAKPVGYK
ncbi:hypothetical protein A2975_02975 [Candidatus Woesebacteria bacterium RIFCSPLOWO2_01_FULL_44_14]|uniref:S1 motif domain-containing protein n=1 Tax=Candidatus Woesebacteria bacterium RIFCSPLOWO2_01_FULL_44_14 TaxID=1802525 RepID=A0A1F8C1K3_9BACT|nr:MAG: hypothetical protein A2975_02975 [Candidatus Woesebacteria bacterium RIFCSPLOWO2_01_FULL_44_14]